MEVLDLIYLYFLRLQKLGELTNHITVLSTSCTTDVSVCGCSYSLCAAWIFHWKQSYSYVFSRWISGKILPLQGDRLYYGRSHCSYQVHLGGQQHSPHGAPLVGQVLRNPHWGFSVKIATSIIHSALYTPFSVATPSQWLVILNPFLTVD